MRPSGSSSSKEGQPVRQPFRAVDESVYINIPGPLASAALLNDLESQAVSYLVARALDTNGSGRVLRSEVARELRRAFSPRHVARVLDDPRSATFWEVDRIYLHLHGIRKILESFPTLEVLDPRTIILPFGFLNTPQRRRAALLAATLVNADGAGRANWTIGRIAGVDRKAIAGWLRDPLVNRYILRKRPVFNDRTGLREQNEWEVPAFTARPSGKLRAEVRSRYMAGATTPQGTYPLRRRYYRDWLHLAKTLQKRRKAGFDVRAELNALGYVSVRTDTGRRRLSPSQAMLLAFGPPDISPHPYRPK